MIFEIALFIAPILSGLLSLLASSTIIWKIFQSRVKLNAPYCRIIFGLSFYDILSSLANMASTMPIPADTSDVFGAVGNKDTCNAQGLLLAFAGNNMPFYILSLCIYFLCVINFSMTDERFGQTIEPYLHCVPFLFGLGSAIYLASQSYIDDAGWICFISVPSGDPALTTKLLYIFNVFPITFTFTGILLTMSAITFYIWRQERRMDQYRFQLGVHSSTTTDRSSSRFSLIPLFSPRSSPSQASLDSSTEDSRSPRIFTFQNRSERNRARVRERIKCAQRQANVFLGAFLISYMPTCIALFATGEDEVSYLDGPNWIITLLSFILYPLQGFFNLLAHLDSRVTRLRNRNASMSYMQALKEAVMTYDDEMDRRYAEPTSSRSSAVRHPINSGAARRRSSRHLESIGDISPRRTTRWKLRLFRKPNEQQHSRRSSTLESVNLIFNNEEQDGDRNLSPSS